MWKIKEKQKNWKQRSLENNIFSEGTYYILKANNPETRQQAGKVKWYQNRHHLLSQNGLGQKAP